jgi:hypothetical protein
MAQRVRGAEGPAAQEGAGLGAVGAAAAASAPREMGRGQGAAARLPQHEETCGWAAVL